MWPNESHADRGRFGKYTYEITHNDLDPKEYAPCTVQDLQSKPDSWVDKPITLQGIFDTPHGQALSFHTRYTAGSHQGFTVWAPDARLWVPSERDKGHPYFFVLRGSPIIGDIEGLPPYQPVVIYGRGTDKIGQGLCVDVERIESLSGARYTDDALWAIKTGDDAAAQGDWAVARSAYKKAAGISMPDAGLSAVFSGWADAAERQDAWPEAAQAYDQACLYDEASWQKAWGAGRCHMMTETWATAADHLERCEKLLPPQEGEVDPAVRRGIRLSLATAHASAGHFRAAFDLFEKLLAENDGDGVALNNYAYALLSSGKSGKDASKALAMARRAADILGEKIHVLSTLGWAQLESGNGAEAASVLGKAHAMDSADAEIAFRYAQALVRTGRPVHARAILVQIVKTPSRFSGRANELIAAIDSEERKLLQVN